MREREREGSQVKLLIKVHSTSIIASDLHCECVRELGTMLRTCRLILYIKVDSLDGVTQLEPEGGWENPFLCYHIQVDCKNCNRELLEMVYLPLYLCAGRMEDAQYHKALDVSTSVVLEFYLCSA